MKENELSIIMESIFRLGLKRNWWNVKENHIIWNPTHDFIIIPKKHFNRYMLLEHKYSHAQILMFIQEVIYFYYPEFIGTGVFLYISDSERIDMAGQNIIL